MYYAIKSRVVYPEHVINEGDINTPVIMVHFDGMVAKEDFTKLGQFP